jgi:hypothetical protein
LQDRHKSEKPDPDPYQFCHQNEKSDPNPHQDRHKKEIRIQIRIRIAIKGKRQVLMGKPLCLRNTL